MSTVHFGPDDLGCARDRAGRRCVDGEHRASGHDRIVRSSAHGRLLEPCRAPSRSACRRGRRTRPARSARRHRASGSRALVEPRGYGEKRVQAADLPRCPRATSPGSRSCVGVDRSPAASAATRADGLCLPPARPPSVLPTGLVRGTSLEGDIAASMNGSGARPSPKPRPPDARPSLPGRSAREHGREAGCLGRPSGTRTQPPRGRTPTAQVGVLERASHGCSARSRPSSDR